jgi:tellurite resistance protein TerC
MSGAIWKWVFFNAFVVAMLVLDLKVFHRHAHAVKLREALGWSAFWVALALLFNFGIYFWYQNPSRPHAALEFLTGYLIEKSLSVDNLFVFLLLFSYFRVAPEHQHTVLFWGILGALVMRLLFIVAGVALINKFHWVIYIFGVVLIISGVKMALEKEKEIHPERNLILKLFRRLCPVSENYEGARLFIRLGGRMVATPLFVVLLVVETTDLIFAVDSIPAILAITRDSFIVYTSNVFAILGLRALYFALAGVMELFHHLHYGLSAILVFVGAKMLLGAFQVEIPIGVALGVVGALLVLSILASVIWPPKR